MGRRGARGSNGGRAESAAADLAADLATVPAAERGRVAQRLRSAAADFEAGRFGDTDRALAPLVKRYGAVTQLLELYGLTQYRLGRWERAASVLSQLRELTGAPDQIPVLADCHRALGDLERVGALWDELRAASADADVMTEGRIVMAGAMADGGDLAGAIRLLEHGPVRSSGVRERHLRIWYALADLYDRAGEYQSARRGFARIVDVDAGYVDAAHRLRALEG